MTATFPEIALLLAAAGIGAVAIQLRQPLILAYIVAGILARLGQVILTTVGYFIAIALAMTPWQEPSA